MPPDKFSLDRYIIKKGFPARYNISSVQGERLFKAFKPIGQKKILVYDLSLRGMPLLTISWKLKKSLISFSYKYNIIDRGHSPLACIECERSLFSLSFNIKDLYSKDVGLIQPEEVGYVYKIINIVSNNKKIAVFYKNAYLALSYVLDLSGDKDKTLNRALALSIGIILAAQTVPMQKFSGPINWQETVQTGDEVYKIKKTPVASPGTPGDDIYKIKRR